MKHDAAYHVVFFIVLALMITACTPFKPTPISTLTAVPPTATINPPTSTPDSGKVDVGGYKLRLQCFGQGTPAVIVDSGLGIAAIESGHWRVVTSAIKKTTKICLYDRAGVGSSDPAPGQSGSGRTSQDIVNDLHTLLVNGAVPAPYILVGHSLGGYNVRLYASQYPEEVAGVVLVDSSHPDQWSEFSAVLPSESRPATDPFSNPERWDLLTSAAQVRATKSLGDLPLVVLTRAPGSSLPPNLPADVSAKIDQIWQDLQNDLAGLSSNSTHIIATWAGHNIPVDEPQLITDAILKVINQAQ